MFSLELPRLIEKSQFGMTAVRHMLRYEPGSHAAPETTQAL